MEALWHLPLRTPMDALPILPIFSVSWLLLSKEGSLSVPDLRAVFSAGWCGCPCTRVPDVTGRASSPVTGMGAAQSPEPCPSASHGFICIVNGHVNNKEILSHIQTFCILKGCEKLPGREEREAQRNLFPN